jgi:hypothetical protein
VHFLKQIDAPKCGPGKIIIDLFRDILQKSPVQVTNFLFQLKFPYCISKSAFKILPEINIIVVVNLQKTSFFLYSFFHLFVANNSPLHQ